MAYDIFISYRRKGGGSERAQLLNARFLLAGYKEDDIFIDVSTIPPGNYRDIITTALEVTNNFVVVMFPGCFDNVSREDSNATDIEKIDDCYVYEIAKALQLGKNVIPVLFDGFDFNKERLPSVLSGLAFSYQNAVVYSRDYPKASFDKLLEFVKPRPNIPPIPKLSIWNKVRDYVKSHKKVLTITISISMAIVLFIPTIGLLNRVDFSSPDSDVEAIFSSLDSDVEAIQSRPSPGLIEQSDTISTQKISSSETTTYTVNGVSFDMVLVKGGTFTMGATSEQDSISDDEKPVHLVTLSDYRIGKTEVTQELWEAVMGSNPSMFKGDNLPVERVSWNDCQEFIKKLNSLTGLNFRLPTEAEWEYAARGGNKSKGYRFSGSNDIGSVAWYRDNSLSQTHQVATKSPNELGLYNMSGNVWEWCSDRYGNYSSGSQTNPKGPSSCVFRGGSWISSAGGCRVSYRSNYCPDDRGISLGLRLAL